MSRSLANNQLELVQRQRLTASFSQESGNKKLTFSLLKQLRASHISPDYHFYDILLMTLYLIDKTANIVYIIQLFAEVATFLIFGFW